MAGDNFRDEKKMLRALDGAIGKNQNIWQQLRDLEFTPEQIMEIPVRKREDILTKARVMMPHYQYKLDPTSPWNHIYLDTARWKKWIEAAVISAKT